MAVVAFPGTKGWGQASNFARTVAKPLSRRDYRSQDRDFKNYAAYRQWWQRKNPDWKPEYGFHKTAAAQRGPIIERDVATRNGVPVGKGGLNTDTLAAALTGKTQTNPWDSYTAMLDKREQDMLERLVRARTQAGIDLFAAMRGFGDAASATAADAWGRALQGYNDAASASGAYQQGMADDYTAGLQAENQRIAQDFAAVGQAGPANIRDTAAAANQVATVGGSNPAALMGLVGKNWESYAETVPGTMSFMQEQNLNQARREAMSDTDKIISEWQQEMLDNPEQAMEMWKAAQGFQWEKEDRAIAKEDRTAAKKAAEAKAAQDARAFNLQVRAFNLKYGAEFADQADKLSKRTGWVHVYNPKTGKFDIARGPNGKPMPTEERRKNMQANATRLKQINATAETAKANRLSREEIARLGRTTRMDIAKMSKNEDKLEGMTPNAIYQMKKNAGDIVNKYYNGALYKDGKTVRIPRESPTKVLARLQALNLPPSVMLDAIAAMAWLPNEDRPDWIAARKWRRKPGT